MGIYCMHILNDRHSLHAHFKWWAFTACTFLKWFAFTVCTFLKWFAFTACILFTYFRGHTSKCNPSRWSNQLQLLFISAVFGTRTWSMWTEYQPQFIHSDSLICTWFLHTLKTLLFSDTFDTYLLFHHSTFKDPQPGEIIPDHRCTIWLWQMRHNFMIVIFSSKSTYVCRTVG